MTSLRIFNLARMLVGLGLLSGVCAGAEPNVKLAEWERGVYVEAKTRPDMRAFLWFYEWTMFAAVNRGQHTRGDWTNEVSVFQNGQGGSISSPPLHLTMLAGEDSVDLKLTVTNESDHDWPALASVIPCFNPGPIGNRNEQFTKSNTWFFAENKLVKLKHREIHFNAAWRAAIDKAADKNGNYVWSSKWPKSPVNANSKAGLLVRESADGEWACGIAWEDFLSCQGNNPWLCMHQSVRVGPLKRGESKTIRGKIYLLKGKKEDVLERYRKDFDVRLGAKILSVEGKAHYFANGKRRALEASSEGGELLGGTTIFTKSRCEVILELPLGGAVVVIKPKSVVTIDELTIRYSEGTMGLDVKLFVKKGCILSCVEKVGAQSRFTVKTPKGVVGIRGTVFSVCASGIFSCYEGMFAVQLLGIAPSGQPPVYAVKTGTRLDASKERHSLSDIPVEEMAEVLTELKSKGVCAGQPGK